MSVSRKRPRVAPPVQALSPSSHGAANLRDLVESFDEEGYAVMSLDAVRNTAFAKAIHYCVQAGGQLTWLEIGAGADALLTRYVLRSGAVGVGRLSSISTSAAAETSKLVLTRTRVCAVEGGAPAAASAERKLAPFRAERAKARLPKLRYEGGASVARISAPVALQSAWALVQGVSSEASAARSVRAVAAAWGLPSGRFPALVHELLGFFASSEWAVQSVRHAYEHLLAPVGEGDRTPRFCVPHTAATFYAPIYLPGDDPVWRIAEHSANAFNFYDGPRGTQIQMRRVPFEDLAVLKEPRVVWRSELFGSPLAPSSAAQPAEVPCVSAGCLELLSFGDPAVLRLETRSREWRNPPGAAPVRCNALAFWLWIQAGPVPQQSNRCFTSPGSTLFPYGCPDADVRACRPLNAPVLSSSMLDFGSGTFSSGWRNFVLFFAGPPAVVAARAAADAATECSSLGSAKQDSSLSTLMPSVRPSESGEQTTLTLVPEHAAVGDAAEQAEPAADAVPSDGFSVASLPAGQNAELTATPTAPPSQRASAKRPRSRTGAVLGQYGAASGVDAASAEADSGAVVPPGGSLRIDTRVHVAPGRAPWYHIVVRVLSAPVVAEVGTQAPTTVPVTTDPSKAGPDAADAPPNGSEAEQAGRAATPTHDPDGGSVQPALPHVAALEPPPQAPLSPLRAFSCVIDTSGREGENALIRAFCVELGIELPTAAAPGAPLQRC